MKKVISIVLCLAMILCLLPPLTIYVEAASVTYSPVTTEYSILNRYSCKNSGFYNAYVKNTGMYNAAGKFGLSPGVTYTRNQGSYTWNNFLDDGSSLTNYGKIANCGQLEIGISATMKNLLHRHGSKLYGADSLAYQYAVLYSGYSSKVLNGYEFGALGTAIQRMGDMEYIPVRVSNKMQIVTGVGRTYSKCNCGDCTIGNIVAAFADTHDPIISRTYTCDANGNESVLVSAGSSIYLRVEFSEPVRFADNSGEHGDIQAKMQDVNSNQFEGNLVSLQDDYLMFRFDIPSQITGNITLSSVDLSSLFGSFGMVLVQNGSSINGQIDTTVYNGEGYTTSASLITDIAGNPLVSPSANKSAALSSACYIDGEAPFVASISHMVQMNNSDVKDALEKNDPGAPDYLDNSDIYAGVCDAVKYTVNFNEIVAFKGRTASSSTFWGLKAYLNVKDGDNYVAVRSAAVSIMNGGINLNNGASKGKVTSVTFEPFTIKAGMVCDDPGGKIKITSVVPNFQDETITDLCGNSYSVTGETEDALNLNPVLLDVTVPSVIVNTAAGATAEVDGSFTPVTEQSNGTVVTAFCLPIQITDSCGTNSLKGGFSWINQENGGSDYTFRYAVTGQSSTTQSTAWQDGVTGQSYSFQQVEGGNYIHIKLIDDSYDLTDTAIGITAQDYAGNKDVKLFKLNYAADSVAPAAMLTGTVRDAASGTLTAKLKVNDKVGITSIGYLWSTDGSVPNSDSPGWTVIGSFAAGAESVEAEAVKSGITAGQIFSGKLYIKAVDTSENSSVTDLGTLTYDNSEPGHALTFTNERTAQAELSVSELEDKSAAVVMVESPYSQGTYYVSVIDSSSHYGDVLNNTSFAAPSYNDLYTWRKYTVSENEGVYSFTYLGGYDESLQKIVNGQYYGELKVTVLVGHAETVTSSFDSTEGEKAAGDAFIYNTNASGVTVLVSAGISYKVYGETVTLMAAPGLTNVYSALITTSDTLGNRMTSDRTSILPSADVGFEPDNSDDDMLSTLEGVKLAVSLSNNIISGWGVCDVDFQNTYFSVIRLYNENGQYSGETIVDKICLSPQAAQNISLPAFSYPSGSYKIVLTVTAKASGNIQRFDYSGSDGIYVDAAAASESFGFACVSSSESASGYGISKSVNSYYGPLYGAVDEDGNVYTQYLAGNETINIPVNTSENRLYFTTDGVSVTGNGLHSHYGEKAIKAWNVTSGVNAANSRSGSTWIDAADVGNGTYSQYCYYTATFVDNTADVTSAYAVTNGVPNLPLIKNTLNTIAYQVVNANGNSSEVRYAYLYPADALVLGTVSVTDTAAFIEEGELTFTPAEGQLMQNVSVFVYDSVSGTNKDITGSYNMGRNAYFLMLSEGGAHNYLVYTVDSYGNYTMFDEKFWTKTDSGAPVVESCNCDVTGGANFTVTMNIRENTIMDRANQTLNLYFESDYMSSLGLNYSTDADTGDYTGEGLKLILPMDSDAPGTVWRASQPNQYGIYQADVTRTDDLAAIKLYGTIRYDAALPEGTSAGHTLYATIKDSFGRTSAPASVAVNTANTKPAYISGSYEQYSTGGGSTSYRALAAAFNCPVMVEKSIATNSPTPYSDSKVSELPVFGDGTHTISFYDVFGTRWTQEIVLDNVFGDYSLSVSISETGYTSEPVTVSVTADHPETAKFNVYESTNGGWTNLWSIFAASYAEFTLSANADINFVLYVNGQNRVDEKFHIVNILDKAPTATLGWYFDEFQSNALPCGVTETSGSVTVWYETSGKVTPSDGTAASYTFNYGDGITSYTFRYTDEAGNAGSATARLSDLGLTLTVPPVPAVDIKPPEYQLFIYGEYDGNNSPVGYYSSISSGGTLADIISVAGYVQSYYFDVLVTDDSPYKLFLLAGANADTSGVSYAGSNSAVIEGVVLSGGSITVTKAAPFTIAIADSAGNVNSFSIDSADLGKYIDNTAPTATIEKVYDTMYQVTSYIKLDDLSDAGMDTGAAAMLSPDGLKTVADNTSGHYGWYYYTFKENKEVLLTFCDGAGNKGSATVTIDSLDTTAPTSSVVWSPYYYDADGNSDTSTPPNHSCNADVIANISYNKPIRNLSAAISFDNGASWTDVTDDTYKSVFRFSCASNNAKVTFSIGNVGVKLTAVALNGKTVTEELYLGDVIDKIPPVVTPVTTYNYITGYSTPQSATIKLVPGEDVYCFNSAIPKTVYSPADEITFTVYKKDAYNYQFTDMAGNSRMVTVLIDKDLDRTNPVITVDKGVPATGNTNVNVKIFMNEAGNFTVYGANHAVVGSHTVGKDEEITVSIANNGSYGIEAVDEAGNRSSTAFVIGSIDKIAPTITFLPYSVSIRRNSDVSALKTLLDMGVTVRDNVTASQQIAIAYNEAVVNRAVIGVYQVTYTATDGAGNYSTATRFVRVYSENELEVLLNGVKTENGGTTVLNSRSITMALTNPLGQEPYSIYLRSGLKTAGQMKSSYTIITPDLNGGFSVPSTGFYTLYIVTQSRQTYLTKIYIEL